MKPVVVKDSFLVRLARQLRYISRDSPTRAQKFRKGLMTKIREIPKRPYSYRQSIYFNDSEIRDLIFKGYTVVFRITPERIEVFGFAKFQEDPTDTI